MNHPTGASRDSRNAANRVCALRRSAALSYAAIFCSSAPRSFALPPPRYARARHRPRASPGIPPPGPRRRTRDPERWSGSGGPGASASARAGDLSTSRRSTCGPGKCVNRGPRATFHAPGGGRCATELTVRGLGSATVTLRIAERARAERGGAHRSSPTDRRRPSRVRGVHARPLSPREGDAPRRRKYCARETSRGVALGLRRSHQEKNPHSPSVSKPRATLPNPETTGRRYSGPFRNRRFGFKSTYLTQIRDEPPTMKRREIPRPCSPFPSHFVRPTDLFNDDFPFSVRPTPQRPPRRP